MNENQLIEIISAFKDGKPIQYKLDTKWLDVNASCLCNLLQQITGIIAHDKEMRVKPDPNPRRYKNSEFIEAQKKHGQFLRKLPLGTHHAECCYTATYCDRTAVKINDILYQYDELLKSFVWADDNSICGVLEEQ